MKGGETFVFPANQSWIVIFQGQLAVHNFAGINFAAGLRLPRMWSSIATILFPCSAMMLCLFLHVSCVYTCHIVWHFAPGAGPKFGIHIKVNVRFKAAGVPKVMCFRAKMLCELPRAIIINFTFIPKFRQMVITFAICCSRRKIGTINWIMCPRSITLLVCGLLFEIGSYQMRATMKIAISRFHFQVSRPVDLFL